MNNRPRQGPGGGRPAQDRVRGDVPPPVAAVPYYMKDLNLASNTIPPGHRFFQYFPVWKPDWQSHKEKKRDALKLVINCDGMDGDFSIAKMVEALRKRQTQAALKLDEAVLTRYAESTAPLTTGLGIEHPLENGFAFLNPYGVPYLPGSSVKGVLRHAAEELASGDYGESKWDIVRIWWLFGFEDWSTDSERDPVYSPAGLLARIQEKSANNVNESKQELSALIECVIDKKHKRRDAWLNEPAEFVDELWRDSKLRREIHFAGSLIFWDVLPKAKDNKLAIDILNPHYSHYYQKGKPPHDAGQPVPNFFLTIPPASEFTFHVEFRPNRLPESLAAIWEKLIDEAFSHIFDWSGFGAKTAVGYGVLKRDTEAEREWIRSREEMRIFDEQRAKELKRAAMSEEERELHELQRWLEEDVKAGRKDPTGRLPNKFAELKRMAERWDQQYRDMLADLAQQLWDFLGWGNRQKKDQRLEDIRRLRESANVDSQFRNRTLDCIRF